MGRTSEAKAHLIETALELIWNDSYHAVGVKEICEKAEVRPGSFYYFFPSKRDLALAAMEHHWRMARTHILEPAFSADVPPLQRIPKLFEGVYAFHAARQKAGKPVSGCFFGCFVGELGEQDNEIKARLQSVLSGIGAYFEQALSDAQKAGDLDLEESRISEAAQALLTYYQGLAILARARNSAEVFRDLSPYAMKLVT